MKRLAKLITSLLSRTLIQGVKATKACVLNNFLSVNNGASWPLMTSKSYFILRLPMSSHQGVSHSCRGLPLLAFQDWRASLSLGIRIWLTTRRRTWSGINTLHWERQSWTWQPAELVMSISTITWARKGVIHRESKTTCMKTVFFSLTS